MPGRFDVGTVLKYYAGYGEMGRVSEGEMGVGYTLVGGNLRGTAMKAQGWAAARFTDDFKLKPADPETDSGAKRLGGCLLRRRAGGKTLGRMALAQAIALLGLKVNAIEKTLPIAIHGVLDARDFGQIDSRSGDHDMFHATTKEGALCIEGAGLEPACGSADLRAPTISNYPNRFLRMERRESCFKGGQVACNSATDLMTGGLSPINEL